MYPSAGTMVEFAAWLTRRRERVCLAQRVDSGPRLVGLVRTTIRNMLTELSLDRLEEGVGDPFLRIAPLRALLGSLRRGRKNRQCVRVQVRGIIVRTGGWHQSM